MKATYRGLFKALEKAGKKATAFSTPAEGEPQNQRMLISLEDKGVWIRVLFSQPGGHGQTEFIVGWDELRNEPIDLIDLGIGKCISAMEEVLAQVQADAALEDAAAMASAERALEKAKAADDAGE